MSNGKNVVKSISQSMERYYRQITGKFYDDTPNVIAICTRDDATEVVRLMKMAMVLAVLCENKEIYINRIMQMEQDLQATIMNMIGPVMNDVDYDDDDIAKANKASAEPASPDLTIDREFALEQELAKMLAEREKFDAEKAKLENQVQGLERENEKLKNERDDDMNTINSKINDTNNNNSNNATNDYVNELKDNIADLEVQLKASKDTITDHEQTLKELSASISADKRAESTVETLQEQLKDAEREVNRLANIENIAERYKRKLQDSKDTDRQIEYLENENEELRKQIESSVGGSKFNATGGNVVNSTMLSESSEAATGDGGDIDRNILDSDSTLIKDIQLALESHQHENHYMPSASKITLEGEQHADLVARFKKLVLHYQTKSKQVDQLTQELDLVSGAWYAVSSRIQQQNVAVMKKAYESPKGWLSRQRQALDKVL